MLLYEIKNYQTTALPLAAWLERPSSLYQEPHVHDCREMVIVRTGTGWCAVNGQRFPMLRGDLYIFAPQDLHEFTNTPGMRFYNVMFADSLFTKEEAELLLPLFRRHGKVSLPCAVFDRVDHLLAELCAELDGERPGCTVAAKSLFRRFLVELLRLPKEEDAGENDGRDPLLASRLLAFVAEHSQEKLTLSDLAHRIGVSSEYAGRLFKSLTGIPFSNYLIQYRVDLACARLENSADSISQIAAELGFFDASYFDKCFRKVLGVSPATYRRRFAGRAAKAPSSLPEP